MVESSLNQVSKSNLATSQRKMQNPVTKRQSDSAKPETLSAPQFDSSQSFTIIVPPVDRSTEYAAVNGVSAGRATHVEVAVHVRPQREMVTSALQQFQDLIRFTF